MYEDTQPEQCTLLGRRRRSLTIHVVETIKTVITSKA
jgi:hypothetical protein